MGENIKKIHFKICASDIKPLKNVTKWPMWHTPKHFTFTVSRIDVDPVVACDVISIT